MNTLDDLGDLAEEFGYEHAPKPPVAVAPFAGIGDGIANETDARERCVKALAALKALDAERTRLGKAAQEAYTRELEALWRQVKKRGRKGFHVGEAEKELGATARDLAERHVAAHKAATVVAYEAKRAELDRLAVEAASLVEIRTNGEDHWYFADVYPDAYRTQTNPERYAEARAHIIAADVEAAGVARVKVRKHEASTKTPFFAVYVYCLEADLPILRKKPGLPLAEMVRLAWKYGANPRVFWPGLPHGYEEEHGIDYFGNAKEPAQMSEPQPATPTSEEPEPI